MTQRARFTKAELDAAAVVAVERGVSIVLEAGDSRITVTPQAMPKVDPFDLVDMSR